jgi:hypothetical protein
MLLVWTLCEAQNMTSARRIEELNRRFTAAQRAKDRAMNRWLKAVEVVEDLERKITRATAVNSGRDKA